MVQSFFGSMAVLPAVIAFLVSCRPDTPDETPVMPEGAVDMGIVMTREDGTTYKLYWAESNLCESGLCQRPEDLGDYYAWGETQPYYATGHSQDNPCTDWKSGKDGYYWNSYKWCNGDNNKLTRYCPSGGTDYWDGGGTPDNKSEFKDYDYADDAARAVLHGKWRMPTRAEWAALCEQCTWDEINVNGVIGYQVTADNGNSIFIPAAGFREGTEVDEVQIYGNYWSSTIHNDYAAKNVLFTSIVVYTDNNYYINRYFGQSVRLVRDL